MPRLASVFARAAWPAALVAAGCLALAIALAPWGAPKRTGFAAAATLAVASVGVIGLRRPARPGPSPAWSEILAFDLPDMLFRADAAGVIEAMTYGSVSLLGRAPEELIGTRLQDLTTDPIPFIDEAYDPRCTITWETRWVRGDGEAIPAGATIRAELDGTGRIASVRGVVRDHRERVAAETALHESEERFRRVLDGSRNGIMLVAHDGRILLTNRALQALLGYSAAELGRLTLAEVVRPAQLDTVMALMTSRMWSDVGPDEYEIALDTADGRQLEVEISLSTFREQGRSTAVMIEVRDLTEARRATELIRRMADYDRLTGLPNRDLFDRHLQRALIDARAVDRFAGVLLLDLDRFGLINDTLGHPSGDRLLKAVGERLTRYLPPRHILARFGGDEFLVLAPDLPSVAAAEGVARRILAAFVEPFAHEGHRLKVSASAGIAVSPAHAEDPDTLVRIADAAMQQAKEEGGNGYHLGSAEAAEPARRRLQLETDLRRAVERQEFEVYYQPQVNLETGEIGGVEALLRWRHPERGLVGPDEFISLLEETGLIVGVGEWVLREACAQVAEWRSQGLPVYRLAVNLSPRQLLVPDLGGLVRGVLQDTGLPAFCLELELTETTGSLNLDRVLEVLEELSDSGVSIAIDDFGIGHSWLGRLRRFPIRTLKVDRSFIAGMAASVDDQVIVRAIVALGHALRLTVVVEGVETADQLALARSVGCDLVQGYFFAMPSSADGAARLLEEWKPEAALAA